MAIGFPKQQGFQPPEVSSLGNVQLPPVLGQFASPVADSTVVRDNAVSAIAPQAPVAPPVNPRLDAEQRQFGPRGRRFV